MNSESSALIFLRTYQYHDGDMDEIELQTMGRYCCKNGEYYIAYEETELTGFEDSTTVIKVEPERVTMTRHGKFKSEMIFQEGETHISGYETPFGTVELGVKSDKLNINLGVDGGTLDLDYILDFDNSQMFKNFLSVAVRPDVGGNDEYN